MYYLNVNGVIKVYATQEDYQKAAAAQAAVSYPEFPLITLSDEHARSLYMQAIGAGGDYSCPELDNLTELGVYRLNANVLQVPVEGQETLTDVYVRTILTMFMTDGLIMQTFRVGAYTFERGKTPTGEWGNWSAIG